MAFHARLRELRESASLSQAALAERAGMSKGGVADLEQGRRQPGWETVQKLAKALGVDCTAFAEEAESDEKAKRGRPRKEAEAETPAETTPVKRSKR